MTAELHHYTSAMKRRHFLGRAANGIGLAALASLLQPNLLGQAGRVARAKHVIVLFMSGGPSHVDLFDYKPELAAWDGRPIPDEFTKGIHFAQISRQPGKPKLKASPYRFERRGRSGTWISELLPHTAEVVDELAVIRSMQSHVFNHDPAVVYLNTGHERVGRPTMGAWMSYGLGSENEDLPAFVVLTSGVKRQPLLDSYWSSGFLPTQHQGVEFRPSGDPVLHLRSPHETSMERRRAQLGMLRWMNQWHHSEFRDPEILTRIRQYELAFRMQSSVPELTDLAAESEETLALYGARPGERSFANNCLMARRLVERGVRFVQLYDMGWDSHGSLIKEHPRQCRAIDRGTAALIKDLKRRGLLDETLIIWGGEFGRTPVVEGAGHLWGRDHHPHGFTMWMAGGGIRGGVAYGETDPFGFHAMTNEVAVHDLHATALHCLGIDHKALTYRFQGRDFRLTDVAGRVIPQLLV